MPVAAQLTPIGGALALDSDQQSSIKSVALGAIAAFAAAPVLELFFGRFFHLGRAKNYSSISGRQILTDRNRGIPDSHSLRRRRAISRLLQCSLSGFVTGFFSVVQPLRTIP